MGDVAEELQRMWGIKVACRKARFAHWLRDPSSSRPADSIYCRFSNSV